MVKKGGSLLRFPPWDLGGLSLDLYFIYLWRLRSLLCMYVYAEEEGWEAGAGGEG